MNASPTRLRTAVLTLFLIAVGVAAQDGNSAPNPSADDIIRKVAAENERRTAHLRSYRSTRVYEVDYKGFGGDRHAKMVVNVQYLAGQKSFTEVSEEGSKLLANRVIRKALESELEAATDAMRRATALTEENYSFEFIAREDFEGRSLFVLRVKPKRKDKYLYDGKVWIDATDFALARVEAQPAKNPSFWITSANIEHYNRSVHGIWLPFRNTSTSKVRFGGRALMIIDYGKYEELTTD